MRGCAAGASAMRSQLSPGGATEAGEDRQRLDEHVRAARHDDAVRVPAVAAGQGPLERDRVKVGVAVEHRVGQTLLHRVPERPGEVVRSLVLVELHGLRVVTEAVRRQTANLVPYHRLVHVAFHASAILADGLVASHFDRPRRCWRYWPSAWRDAATSSSTVPERLGSSSAAAWSSVIADSYCLSA